MLGNAQVSARGSSCLFIVLLQVWAMASLCVVLCFGQNAALTQEQIIRMSKVGLPEDVIVTRIKAEPIPLKVGTDDLIKLKRAGVSDGVIRVLFASTLAPAAAPPAKVIEVAARERAFMVDAGTNSVIALDTKTTTILGSVPIAGGFLTSMIQIPHSKRLAVFDRGPGKGALRYGWHPDGKASVSFVDMDLMKVTSRLELGWSVS
jgi:hypothetical protein